jgi:Nucleotidyl transferase AbiEii toxin, Type IV TA system
MAVLKSPHLETIPAQMLGLLAWLGEQAFLRRFYLAGGTSLALQLGHRRSVDLDFFSETDQIHEQTRREIISILAERNGQVVESTDGNLLLLVDGIQVGFFSYAYPLLDKGLEFQNARLASLLDIGLMKLDALMGRGSRKDFYDLYVLCQKIPFDTLLEAGARKYPQMRDFALMSVESMLIFDNADRDNPPELLVEVGWDTVKAFFVTQARQLGKRWFWPE